METGTFTIFRAILLGGTSSSSSFQADISALTEPEAKGLFLQMAEREPGLLFDIMRQNTPRTVGSAVAPNWSLSRNDQRCRTIIQEHLPATQQGKPKKERGRPTAKSAHQQSVSSNSHANTVNSVNNSMICM